MKSKLDELIDSTTDAEMVGLFDKDNNEITNTGYKRQNVTLVKKKDYVTNPDEVVFLKHEGEKIKVEGVGFFDKDDNLILIASLTPSHFLHGGYTLSFPKYSVELSAKDMK